MSTLKTNNVQVGQSVTATNNFTIYQPSTPDGTVRIGVGNSGATTGDAVTINSTGIVKGSLVSDTAKTASGTSVDFTGIPSTAKRITVMFSGVSTNGTSIKLVQVGSGSVSTSGYISTSSNVSLSALTTSSTAGFVVYSNNASDVISGVMVLTLISGNEWVSFHSVKAASTISVFGGGNISLSGTLDRIRITTVNGTDTFDAGTINIMWEG